MHGGSESEFLREQMLRGMHYSTVQLYYIFSYKVKWSAEEELTSFQDKSSAVLAKIFFNGQPWLCQSLLLWLHRRKMQLKSPPPPFFLLLNFLAVTSVLLKTQKCGFYACAVVTHYDSVREIVGVDATGSPHLGSVSWDYVCVLGKEGWIWADLETD